MRESAAKRAEEARFFAEFDDGFARRHHEALAAIAERVDLEYVGLDSGKTPDGELLVFEVDSGMTVHAMDPVEIFPFKQPQMRKVGAFRQMLQDRSFAGRSASDGRGTSGAGRARCGRIQREKTAC